MFDVATPGACSIIVAQIEGRVEVTLPCQPATHKRDAPHRLQPGSRLVYDAAHATQTADPVSPATEVDEGWVSGLIPYRGYPVSRMIADVNRYSSITIVASTPEIADMRVRTNLNIRNAPNVADHLARVLDLIVDDSEPGRLVLRKRQ